MAGLHGADGLCVAAIHGESIDMGAQLHAALRRHALGIDLLALLKSYGTASGRFKVIGALNTAWLPGFAPIRT